MSLTADDLTRLLLARLPPGLQIPPPCLTGMGAEPVAWRDGESLTMRFPVRPEYANPLGYMQGGFIVAALDNTLGPFSYLIAPQPMDLTFTVAEILAVVVSALLITQAVSNGETNWFEGLQLLGLYGILAVAFYFFPG